MFVVHPITLLSLRALCDGDGAGDPRANLRDACAIFICVFIPLPPFADRKGAQVYALELLLIVLNHPASVQETVNRAARFSVVKNT